MSTYRWTFYPLFPYLPTFQGLPQTKQNKNWVSQWFQVSESMIFLLAFKCQKTTRNNWGALSLECRGPLKTNRCQPQKWILAWFKCTWEDRCKHKSYPIFLTYLHLEGSPILSRSPHHKRFASTDRAFYKLAKVTWTKAIQDCMRKLRGFEFVHRPSYGHWDV